MRNDNIKMLNDTLSIMRQGYYTVNGKKIKLKLSKEQIMQARVFLPDEIINICHRKDFPHVHVSGRCRYSCENIDSFSMARKQYKYHNVLNGENAKEILVLNFANSVNPGGSVYMGSNAQEEDLCRKSSLLLSLESESAGEYYRYNKSLQTNLGSDGIIISPKVEIIRDDKGNLLEDSVVVAVMTCAAPMITWGKEGLTDSEYEQLFYERINCILKCAAYLGYTALVLGAFGCGAFGNDAKLVSDLFYKALKEFNFDGMSEKDMFHSIDFAVLDRSVDKYNYTEFYRNFSCFYRDEDAEERMRIQQSIKEKENDLDIIRGCLFGGAVGDALGYPVEFLSIQDIIADYGDNGITEYEYDKCSGKALISDDTQMTLFTANGLLHGDTRGCLRGIKANPRTYVAMAYQDWYRTQIGTFTEQRNNEHCISWLCDVPQLYSLRAPGNTCLSALADLIWKKENISDFIKKHCNDSKGCGGVMRIAPLALNYKTDIKKLDIEAAQLAAITHGHSLGYMPAAVLCHILNRILYPVSYPVVLKNIILEARDTVRELFKDDPHIEELTKIIDLAIKLSGNDESDIDNIMHIGAGWVAEETLGIAIYCSLRYPNDFSTGIIAAVNHSGDSDSTGAVTGNILGALVGYEAIEQKWKNDLELAEVVLEIADDICHGCKMSEYSSYKDRDWTRKYVNVRWKSAECD